MERYADSVAKGSEVFKKAWRQSKALFKTLAELCGGSISVLPDTATVEMEFSIMQWKKHAQHAHLTNLSLKGIFQCKQLSKALKLAH